MTSSESVLKMELLGKGGPKDLGLCPMLPDQFHPNWASLQPGQVRSQAGTFPCSRPQRGWQLVYFGDLAALSSAARLMVCLFPYCKLFISISYSFLWLIPGRSFKKHTVLIMPFVAIEHDNRPTRILNSCCLIISQNNLWMARLIFSLQC